MPVPVAVDLVAALLRPGDAGQDERQDVERQVQRPQDNAGDGECETGEHTLVSASLEDTQQDVDRAEANPDGKIGVHMSLA